MLCLIANNVEQIVHERSIYVGIVKKVENESEESFRYKFSVSKVSWKESVVGLFQGGKRKSEFHDWSVFDSKSFCGN